MDTLVRPRGPNGEVPRPLRSLRVFVETSPDTIGTLCFLGRVCAPFAILAAKERAMEQKIAQSVFDFRKLREDGYIYVDKTATLYPLLTRGSDSFFFISRPRRFGKSLMLSTLENIFRGRRELFKGLAIDKMDYDWAEYPILHFNFATMETETVEAFRAGFVARVQEFFEAAKVAYNPTLAPNDNFSRAIKTLAREWGKPVVILIDEYDAPVGATLNDPEKAKSIRSTLSTFYGEIKNNASYIRFMMMTGVTRFTQLSVFSALNNLNDLTMDSSYATLLGYTEEELETNFSPSLHAHAEVMGLSYENYRAELRRWYNGYRFSPDTETRVYNPVAIAKTLGLKRKIFVPTWSKTGRPSVLINFLTEKELTEMDYDNVENVSEEALDICRLEAITPVSMLYQGGYLTIKDYSEWGFTLGVPNEEVRRDLVSLLAQYATKDFEVDYHGSLCTLLGKCDFQGFFSKLKALYAHLTYGSTETRVHESSYLRPLYALLASHPALRVIAEDTQAQGRADLVVESQRNVFIFELKVDKSAAEALAQIKANGYAEPYCALGKPIHIIGLNFKSANHSLSDAIEEPLA